MTEKFGEVLLPHLIKLVSWMTKMIEKFDKLIVILRVFRRFVHRRIQMLELRLCQAVNKLIANSFSPVDDRAGVLCVINLVDQKVAQDHNFYKRV
jgi:hypothetical protein